MLGLLRAHGDVHVRDTHGINISQLIHGQSAHDKHGGPAVPSAQTKRPPLVQITHTQQDAFAPQLPTHLHRAWLPKIEARRLIDRGLPTVEGEAVCGHRTMPVLASHRVLQGH